MMRFVLLTLLSSVLAFGALEAPAAEATANLFVDLDGDGNIDFFQLDQIFAGNRTVQVLGSDQTVIGSNSSQSFDIDYSYDTSADVATGQIKVKATSVNNAGRSFDATPSTPEVFSTQGVLQDTLRFTSATGDPYDVIVNLDVTGSLINSSADGNVTAFLRADGFPSDQALFSANGDHATTLSVTASLSGTSASVDLFTSLTLGFFGLGEFARVDVDFSNTAALSLVLPEGVALDTSGGGLLSATIVPVPAAFIFFASGLAGLWLRRFRRR